VDGSAKISVGNMIVPVPVLMPLDFRKSLMDVKENLAEPLSYNHMAELSDRPLVWRCLIPKVNAHDIPHRCAVIETALGLSVSHVGPSLQEVDAQHPFNPNRWATSLPWGVMRLNQGTTHPSRQEALSPCRLVVAVKAEAGEAFLPHRDPAQRLSGRCITESEISSTPRYQD
jgi:hypothetical protein